MISGSILQSSAMGAPRRWWIRLRGSCGGAIRASTAIPSFPACWRAARRRVLAMSCSRAWSTFPQNMCAAPRSSPRVLTDDKGASIRVTDFAPRFREYDRIFRPPQLMRIIEPVADQAWNEKRGAFPAAIGIDDLDASVLLLPEIGFVETAIPASCGP